MFMTPDAVKQLIAKRKMNDRTAEEQGVRAAVTSALAAAEIFPVIVEATGRLTIDDPLVEEIKKELEETGYRVTLDRYRCLLIDLPPETT
jgi:signal recognition particle GTPase